MMRKVYIVRKDADREQAIADAEVLGIGEVAFGIPPKIAKVIGRNHKLPYVYEEPVIPEKKTKLEELEERIAELEEKLNVSG